MCMVCDLCTCVEGTGRIARLEIPSGRYNAKVSLGQMLAIPTVVRVAVSLAGALVGAPAGVPVGVLVAILAVVVGAL